MQCEECSGSGLLAGWKKHEGKSMIYYSHPDYLKNSSTGKDYWGGYRYDSVCKKCGVCKKNNSEECQICKGETEWIDNRPSCEVCKGTGTIQPAPRSESKSSETQFTTGQQ